MRKNRAVDFGHDTLTTFDLNEAQFKDQVRIFIFFENEDYIRISIHKFKPCEPEELG